MFGIELNIDSKLKIQNTNNFHVESRYILGNIAKNCSKSILSIYFVGK
jgi:hypothetical protein